MKTGTNVNKRDLQTIYGIILEIFVTSSNLSSEVTSYCVSFRTW